MSLLILVPLLLLILFNLPLQGVMKRVAFGITLLFLAGQLVLALNPAWLLALDKVNPLAQLFPVQLAIDNLSLVMLLAIAIVSLTALFVAKSGIACDGQRFTFINLLLLTVIGMDGVVMVNDLFSLYVFLEITGAASWILIAFHGGKFALEGAFKYLLLSAIATVMMLSAIAVFMLITTSTTFADVAQAIKLSPAKTVSLVGIMLFLGGLFIKSGLVPFHGWLPDAYASAPNAVSVLLAGIVTKTTGVYTLIRLVTNVFGFTPALTNVLLVVGLLSVLIGALAALGQSDMKRMLAYSSISQVGYIILGLATNTVLGLAGAVLHLFNHAIFKSLLFVNAAAVEEQTGTCDMDKLGGVANKMGWTGFTSAVGFLSTAGIPPLSGFWSKLVIIIALWQTHHYAYATLAILASLLTLAYFLSMQRRVFFGQTLVSLENIKEAKAWLVWPALLLAFITIGIGVLFPKLINTLLFPVDKFLW